jgi:hypothetical protein
MLRPRSRVPHRQRHLSRADARAAANLRFIRETMEQSGRFTAIPGRGMVLMGLTAIIAALIASRQTSTDAWLAVWVAEAALALAIGSSAMVQKANGLSRLVSGPGRKFIFSLAPPLLAGGILTILLQQNGLAAEMPGVWLLLYGTGVVAAGTYSVTAVPAGGACFMALGALALLLPAHWGDYMMAAGFGGIDIAIGVLIARRYGG